jgi:hypothetical protein
MLAPLGFFLLALFTTCALILLIFGVVDADRSGIQAGRDLPVILKFPVHPHRGSAPPGLPSSRVGGFTGRARSSSAHRAALTSESVRWPTR